MPLPRAMTGPSATTSRWRRPCFRSRAQRGPFLRQFLPSLAVFLVWATCRCGAVRYSDQDQSSVDVDLVTSKLFPLHRTASLREDSWTSLSHEERRAWTSANYLLSGPDPFDAARESLLSRPPLLVPIRVIIVDVNGSVSSDFEARPGSLDNVMRAGFGEGSDLSVSPGFFGRAGIRALFKIELARREVTERVSVAVRRDRAELRRIVEKEYSHTVTWHGANVIFMCVGLHGLPSGKLCEDVEVGAERLAWVRCHVPDSFFSILNAAEAAAQKVFVPVPSYFPVVTTPQLRIHVHPYTPQYAHRAPWMTGFDWASFEETVRSLAPSGQIVGFFSTQTNEECEECSEALSNVDSILADGGARIAFALNHRAAPNASWSLRSAYGPPANDDPEDAVAPEFNIYVIDVARSVSERRGPGEPSVKAHSVSFPGLAVIVTQSSLESRRRELLEGMVGGIASGAYGVPDLSLFAGRLRSPILSDIVQRHVVCSMLAIRAREVNQLLGSIKEYDINPSKSLDETEYASVLQRLNLLLYKQFKARDALSSANHASDALHFAQSVVHDVRAIRRSFGLGRHGEAPTNAGFRDPAMRCHFSRVKRGALLAGQLLHRNRSLWKNVLYPLFSLGSGFAVARAMLIRAARRKNCAKRH